MQSCAPGILRKIVAASSKLVKSRSPKNRSTGALIVANSGFEMPQSGFDHIALTFSKNTSQCLGPSGETRAYSSRNAFGRRSAERVCIALCCSALRGPSPTPDTMTRRTNSGCVKASRRAIWSWIGSPDSLLNEKGKGIFGHAFIGQFASRDIGRMPMAHLLDGNYAMIVRQRRNLRRKRELNGGHAAMQEHHGPALAMHLVVHFQPVNLSVFARGRPCQQETKQGNQAHDESVSKPRSGDDKRAVEQVFAEER